MTGHSNTVRSVAFSPDGKHIVSGSEDKTIRLRDAQTGQPALEPSSDSVDKAVDQVSRALEATSLVEPSEPTSETSQSEEDAESKDISKEDLEPLNVELTPIKDSEETAAIATIAPEPSKASASKKPPTPIYDDPSDEDDGEGEWITPENVALHKSRALDLLPDPSSSRKGKEETIGAGCMTADFAMQNVLLQMGLNLVGLEGKRIEKVKTWVLRCHACYKFVLPYINPPLLALTIWQALQRLVQEVLPVMRQ
jgi:RNA-binding protein NOB1